MDQLPSLTGQVAVVTGAGTGIGRAAALAVAAAGARVVVNHPGFSPTDASSAEAVVQAIVAEGGEAVAVADEDAVGSLFAEAVRRFGALDILIANAGIQRDAPFEAMTLADWQAVIDVNLTGSFLCARAAVRQFLAQGCRPSISAAAGKIVCISSVHETIPWAGHANYAASKGGVSLMVKTLAQEFAGRRIRVNAVAPGAIRTDINRAGWSNREGYQALLSLIPYGRIGEPVDVARAVLWLCSDAADYVTGATLAVDGGMLLYPGFASGG